MTKMISTYIDDSVAAKLEEIAKAEERSVSWLVGFAVKQMIAARQPNGGFPKVASDSRQVDLEDAIAAAVKKGPVKSAKHK